MANAPTHAAATLLARALGERPAGDVHRRHRADAAEPQHLPRHRVRRGEEQRGGDHRQGHPAGGMAASAAIAALTEHDAGAQHQPHPRIDDEQGVAVEPAPIEGMEEADAVGVEPVERGMRERREIGEPEQRRERCRCGDRARLPRSPRSPSLTRDPHHPRHQQGQDDETQRTVGQAAANASATSLLQKYATTSMSGAFDASTRTGIASGRSRPSFVRASAAPRSV